MAKKTKETFNPIKEDKDGVIARRMIWSTKPLELALKGLNEGKNSIFYKKIYSKHQHLFLLLFNILYIKTWNILKIIKI